MDIGANISRPSRNKFHIPASCKTKKGLENEAKSAKNLLITNEHYYNQVSEIIIMIKKKHTLS